MRVNFAAPINSLGMGVVGVNLLAALSDAGVEPALFPIGPIDVTSTYKSVIEMGLRRAEAFDAKAPSVRYWHPNQLAQHVGKGQHIGYTIFESDRLSATEIHNLLAQDLIVVPSRWARKVLVENHNIPRDRIRVVNHGVDTDTFAPTPLPEGPTTFYTTGKFEVRKGHYEVCQAFNLAFEPKDNVLLVVHCANPFLSSAEQGEWENLFRTSKMGRAWKIEIVNGRFVSQEEVAQLVSRVHCGVFPSRAEGWNLPLCECMAMGRHVIATDYSAHTEFCLPSSANLIQVDEQEAAFDGKWFNGRGNWAKLGPRQLDQLIWHMQNIHQKNETGLLSLNQNGVVQMEGFNWDRAAERLKEVISE